MKDQDRRWLDDLVKDTSNDLYEQAVAIYEELGASYVIEWGSRVGLKMEYCQPCESNTPTIGGDCAVCGTIRSKDTSTE